MIKYVCIYLAAVFVSSVSQIILKKSANKKYNSKIKEYLNLQVIVAYTFFFLASLFSVLAYKGIPMSMGPIIEASGYIWVTILGMLFLKEKLTIKKVVGLLVIVIGIAIFALC